MTWCSVCVCLCKYGNVGHAQKALERRQKRVKTGDKEVRGWTNAFTGHGRGEEWGEEAPREDYGRPDG